MKTLYRHLCEENPELPIFLNSWWLDTLVGPEHWDVVTVEENQQVVAALPYTVQKGKRSRLIYLGQPPLCQYLGPWIKPSAMKQTASGSREKKLLTLLESHLPRHHMYQQNWSPENQNWLPFYWKGYEQSTRYTYRIAYQPTKTVWENLHSKVRGDIRKAENRYKLQISSSRPVNELITLVKKTFLRQNTPVPFSEEKLKQLFLTTQSRNCGETFFATDPSGAIHAAIYCVWDSRYTYYLLSGTDPEHRHSGALSLCIWHAIQKSFERQQGFDFEGSIIENIESFFRSFGAEQTPYFSVRKINHKPLKLYYALQSGLS